MSIAFSQTERGSRVEAMNIGSLSTVDFAKASSVVVAPSPRIDKPFEESVNAREVSDLKKSRV